jgi:hypothetical protein
MDKKKYAVQWEEEKAVAFEVDGVRYASLKEIPDPQDRRKLREMLSTASFPDFDAQDWEAARKESDKAQQIILWVFSRVAALMLLITVIAAWMNVTQVANERSADGVVIEMVMRYDYAEDDSGRVVGEVYYPKVRFTGEDDRRHEVQLSEGSYPPAYEVGDKVTVRYNPERPTEARIDSAGSTMLMWVLPAITGVLGLGFLGAVLAVRWLVKQ